MGNLEVSNKLLKQIFNRTGFSITGQILGRIISVLLSSFIIHYVYCKEALAIMNVRLSLLESIIILLSRDAMRQACQESLINHDWPKVINLIWIIVPICILNSMIFGIIWIYFLETPIPEELKEQYYIGVLVICISCVIESFSEVPNFLTKSFFFNKTRIVISLIYTVTRSVVFMTIVYNKPNIPIHAFSCAQLLSAIAWSASNFIYFIFYLPAPQELVEQNFPFKTIADFLPSFQNWQLPNKLSDLWAKFYLTVLVKQILQEGERCVMVLGDLLPLTKQASYDIVQSIGILPMRLILRPLDDALYFYYSQKLKRGNYARQMSKMECLELSTLIYNFLRSAIFFGILTICFGAYHSSKILNLYTGTEPSKSEEILLQLHGVFFILIAILTLTESFSLAAIHTRRILNYNFLLVILAILYIPGIWMLTNLFGLFGMLAARCLVITLRLCYCAYIVFDYFHGSDQQPLFGLIPSIKMFKAIATFLAVSFIIQWLLCEKYAMLHLLVGLIVFFGVLFFYFIYQEPEIWEMFAQNDNVYHNDNSKLTSFKQY